MQYLKQFLAILFSRQVLAFAAIVALSLAIWFVGPALAIDGLRPLAATGVRVTFIVLLLLLGMLWLVSGPYSLVGVAASCLLVWHAGPLLAVGEAKPLASAWVRMAIIGAVVLACALYWLYRFWQALRNNEDLLARFLNFGRDTGKDGRAKEEIKNVAAVVHRALAQLKGLRGAGGLRGVLEGKRYLYELPWYMIIGSPGAGKTTALLNAGLQFPLARQEGPAPKRMVFRSAGGTLNSDWWFTNEAVLIDTAGRYTTQESNPVTDAAEWHGFLGLLRKHRTRAPLNGVIVVLDAAELLTMTVPERAGHAAMVRDRLAELREELGIRFPVYVVVTKVDLLRGFTDYFQSLTSEGRSQAWGFTLPFHGMKSSHEAAQARDTLRTLVEAELALLKQRLAAGLRARLNEEFDVDRRKRLFALPQELAGLSRPLVPLLDDIFLASRFDRTQLHDTLRGVYFTSGEQADEHLPADPDTLLQRLRRKLGARPSRADESAPTRGKQGFFLQDVLTKVIFPEAHLVRPNLRWELRFRLLRLAGHALCVVMFLWLAGALAFSFANNRQYLDTVGQRAEALRSRVHALFADFRPTGVPDVLNGARELPGHAGLDLDNPSGAFLYGLYTPPPILAATGETYARLQDHMLLPTILQRMEAALAQSVKDGDAKGAYETLRVYKLLHDRNRYMKGGARDVRNWVLKDWENADSAAVFGGRASMIDHVTALFSGERLVQSGSLPNEALLRSAQDFLNGNTATQRVYERAKAAMLAEAPHEFTLVRAVGPQAGTVFSRTDGLPLEKGVPGLFTYDGYHDVFNKHLPEFVGRALDDDAWVMGRGATAVSGLQESASTSLPRTGDAARRLQGDPLLEDIRRQYLAEYAGHWEVFLGSIRTVSGGDAAGTSLGFDLNVLRQFAAPDSPLARLARAAARETTLSRPLTVRTQEEKGLLDKASDALDRQTSALGRSLGIRAEERLERQLVDHRFAALREVVTGQPDIGAEGTAAAARPGLELVSGLINEYYTLLVVADTALAAGSLPPGGTEVGARLKLEAGKLPAPFREVLTALAVSGSEKVVEGSESILRSQAQLQLDRIMGLLAMQVSEPCKRGVEGRYPLAAVAQDASIEDFTQVFAVGGAADEFFARYLASYVDTSVRPWRYKDPNAAGALAGTESPAPGLASMPVAAGPTLLGELLKLLAHSGPNLDAFYRAQQIRDLFFRDAGGKKFAWKMELRVLELEPGITDLVLDIDGQGQRYVHGPVQPFFVAWPGSRGGATAEITANPRISVATSTIMASGPWALFRLIEKGRIVSTATPGRLSVEYAFDGRKALIDISSGSQPNPLSSDVLKGFRCPGRSA
ncbi:MAG: type VI secretion system membrane subunit TssM [Luteibacter sp.]|uniref:type VI secretion system membrane subunit TssM n=1 Tax=Luteibacter sp. TaxID=1886636 RepID=UPI0028085A8E|nr:type VI secretion system membrane subunit TssM [Luteibacter sp.]MDQ7998138.1 type VI secretion system membrane subunit TssM [Luteibacter sp.]